MPVAFICPVARLRITAENLVIRRELMIYLGIPADPFDQFDIVRYQVFNRARGRSDTGLIRCGERLTVNKFLRRRINQTLRNDVTRERIALKRCSGLARRVGIISGPPKEKSSS